MLRTVVSLLSTAVGHVKLPPVGESTRRTSPWSLIFDRRSLIVLAAAFAALVPTPTSWVESVYSLGFYSFLQRSLTPLTSRVPFALFDLLAVLVVGGLAIWWVVRLITASRGTRLHAAFSMAVNTAVLIAVVYLVFLVTWGLNYRREPLREKLDFEQDRVTQEALLDLARQSVAELNQLHELNRGVSWPSLAELPDVLAPAFERAQRQLPGPRTAVTGRPKRSLLSFYFRRAAIDGMTDPFFLEILINHEVLPFERPFVVAHEWAHLAGYADESEANFVGWLTCLAGDAAARYSGWLFLTPHLFGNLPDGERRATSASLAAGPRRDLDAIASRLSRSTPVVRRNARRVYDRFLKANRVADGIASYGAVVELVLGAQDSWDRGR